MRALQRSAAFLLVLSAPAAARAQELPCGVWLPTFGPQDGPDGTVEALVVFDDGSGPALYAGGSFAFAGAVAAANVARFDGAGWSALGSGVDGTVRALVVHDDGGGPALFAGGDFASAGGAPASRVARWDGASWAPLASGTNGTVRALAVHDDGGGSALYAGGDFTSAGGLAASRVARWDGAGWLALGSGPASVEALAAFDDGGGARLYRGTRGGTDAVQRWNGSSWEDVSVATTTGVRSLLVADLGSGPELYAGGNFWQFGEPFAAAGVARFDGTGWYALGEGLGDEHSFEPVAEALAVCDLGDGPRLFAGGTFSSADGLPASGIAQWDGASWAPLASGVPDEASVYALASFDDGDGLALFAGGDFQRAGSQPTSRMARWDGDAWSGFGGGLAAGVHALALHDDGSGDALYVGGDFTVAGDATSELVWRWDGAQWSALGAGLHGGTGSGVLALATFDEGAGPALFAGGDFSSSGGVGPVLSRVARWDGASWSPLGAGLNGPVRALATHDDGSGPALYAGGSFSTSGGTLVVPRVARWDGWSWSAVGDGLGGGPFGNDVRALVEYDDGGGPELIAAGSFTSSGATVARRVARWDGVAWSPLAGGLNGPVNALAVDGATLYAAGEFSAVVGGVAAANLARWDGASWSSVGAGLDGPAYTLRSLDDDGAGPALVVGGDFAHAGGVAASRIARWRGGAWSALGGGVDGAVRALAPPLAGYGLFAGGDFRRALDSGDAHLARLGCGDATPPTIDCPPDVVVHDRLEGAPGEAVSFSVVVFDDVDPSPDVVCVPPSGSTFAPGTTWVVCTATDDSGNVATCSFAITVRRGRAAAR